MSDKAGMLIKYIKTSCHTGTTGIIVEMVSRDVESVKMVRCEIFEGRQHATQGKEKGAAPRAAALSPVQWVRAKVMGGRKQTKHASSANEMAKKSKTVSAALKVSQ